METPEIDSVPRLPTMILSTSPTALVIPIWIIMGTASMSVFLYMKFCVFFTPLFIRLPFRPIPGNVIRALYTGTGGKPPSQQTLPAH